MPGAGYTGAWGINSAGDVVGNYGQNIETDSHGFLLQNGSFALFDYPGLTMTIATGINDSGLIVGHAGNLQVVGFLYDGTTFTTIQDGSYSATFALGINNAALVVGGAGNVGATRGFELRGQRFKNISPPPGGWIYVYATGINNLAEVVGWYTGATTNGFTYKNGKFRTLSVPGAYSITEAEGLNDGGIVVGWYDGCSSPQPDCAFAYMNGKYISFIYPGAYSTFATGINASGQIVGEYQLADGTYRGFVTSPISAADFETGAKKTDY